MSLNFLNQFWKLYPEYICEIGVGAFDKSSDAGNFINAVALIEDEDIDRDTMLENAALIAQAPQMFRLLVRSLKSIRDDELKSEIHDVLSAVIKPVWD